VKNEELIQNEFLWLEEPPESTMEKVFGNDEAALFRGKWTENTEALRKEVFDLDYVYDLPIKLFGRVCHQHRGVLFLSDEISGYKYSGQLLESRPLPPSCAATLLRVNEILGTTFNAILLNMYRDGNDSIGAHSDSEAGLCSSSYGGMDGKIVASLSFGATRPFRIRRKGEKGFTDIPLNDGDLCVMAGCFQDLYTHEIPASKRIPEPRVSLTFRYHSV
jgi:alkylated DNA repair dioxygenase AlkB